MLLLLIASLVILPPPTLSFIVRVPLFIIVATPAYAAAPVVASVLYSNAPPLSSIVRLPLFVIRPKPVNPLRLRVNLDDALVVVSRTDPLSSTNVPQFAYRVTVVGVESATTIRIAPCSVS